MLISVKLNIFLHKVFSFSDLISYELINLLIRLLGSLYTILFNPSNINFNTKVSCDKNIKVMASDNWLSLNFIKNLTITLYN